MAQSNMNAATAEVQQVQRAGGTSISGIETTESSMSATNVMVSKSEAPSTFAETAASIFEDMGTTEAEATKIITQLTRDIGKITDVAVKKFGGNKRNNVTKKAQRVVEREEDATTSFEGTASNDDPCHYDVGTLAYLTVMSAIAKKIVSRSEAASLMVIFTNLPKEFTETEASVRLRQRFEVQALLQEWIHEESSATSEAPIAEADDVAMHYSPYQQGAHWNLRLCLCPTIRHGRDGRVPWH